MKGERGGVRGGGGGEILDKPPQRITVTSHSVGHGLLGGPLLAAVLGEE